ncbi:MAG: CBS and ACT domain-containing protein [Desulfobacterales bacterium]|jgi:acetoin utilization protein AcuB|nr:CBS and ACT domain-containing protein [Desulfobacterales bacterium]
MLVMNWMCQPAITINADDVVADAATLLQKHEIHMLPVMQKGKLVGIVTDRDIKRVSPSDVISENRIQDSDFLAGIIIKEIMTPDPVTIPYDYSLAETVEKFLVHKISSLPVVNQQQKVIGVITKSDFFYLFLILTGFGKKGLQFAIEVEDRPESLKTITDIMREYGGHISSILSTRERARKGYRRLYIRVFEIDQPSLQHLKEIISKKANLLYIIDHNEKKREWFQRIQRY